MTVPSTPTATDANLERKKILDEIATLTQTRDTLRRETGQWQEARDAVKHELEMNSGLVLSTKEYDQKLSTELIAKRDALKDEVDALQKTKDSRTIEVRDLDVSITNKKEEVIVLTGQVSDLKKDTEKHAELATVAKRDHIEALEQKNTELAAVGKEIETAKVVLEATQKEHTEKQAWILSESTRLAKKGADLAIYEGRIRKQAREVGINLPAEEI